MEASSDVIVVGAGIIGLAVADRALRRGLTVRVIDQTDRAVGSSVQNFGHLCFAAQSDAAQDLARRSAEGWRTAAADAGLWLRGTGTTVAACTDVERQVLEEFAARRGPDQVRLMDAAEVGLRLGSSGPQVLGGAHLPGDMITDPRTAAPSLARMLIDRGADLRWNERVLHVADGEVTTAAGSHRAERVILSPGVELRGLLPDLAEEHGLAECALIMALVERPASLPEPFALLTGTSMTRYAGFTAMPSSADLRAELAAREPELTECAANLMVTGSRSGLLVGDSHSTGTSHDPFIDESTSQLLLSRAADVLGIPPPPVRQRWLGRYPTRPDGPLLVRETDAHTTAVVVTSGIGMTLAFGLADMLLDGEDPPL